VRIFSRAVRGLHKATLGRVIARKEISHLRTADEEIKRSLGGLLDAQMANRWSSEEQDWIERIESLRNELNTSSRQVVRVDYGAGSPDSRLTAEEMHRGTVVFTTVGEICRVASIRPKWGWLLFRLVRQYRPTVCLELGTALGISTAYQAAALRLNHHGRILTLEGSESSASLARENFGKLGLEGIEVVLGRFQDTLQEVLHQNGTIDYVFIDGHHDELATLSYFREIYPHLAEGAILVLDDISWSSGMQRAWDAIKKDNRLKACVDLMSVGICVFTKSAASEVTCHKIPI
jgi:predicted O-methyltransferase YrrM